MLCWRVTPCAHSLIFKEIGTFPDAWTLLQPVSNLSLFLTLPEVSSVISAYVIYFKRSFFKLSFHSRMFINYNKTVFADLELPCTRICQSSRLQSIPESCPHRPMSLALPARNQKQMKRNKTETDIAPTKEIVQITVHGVNPQNTYDS